MPASTNLCEARPNWPIPPTKTPIVVKKEKTEAPPRVAAILHTMILNKSQNNRPAEEKCTWWLHCPTCTKEEEGTEDWNGDRQESQQRTHYPPNPQHPQAYDIPNRFSQQIKPGNEWNEKMECFNEKANLDYYSSFKFDSDFQPEHKYETLI